MLLVQQSTQLNMPKQHFNCDKLNNNKGNNTNGNQRPSDSSWLLSVLETPLLYPVVLLFLQLIPSNTHRFLKIDKYYH